MKLSSKQSRLVGIALLAIALVASGFGLWRAMDLRSAVAAILPERPNLDGFVPELGRRLEAAEGSARSLWNSRGGLSELARLYQANGFLSQARECQRSLVEIDPQNPTWPYFLGNIAGGYGDLQTALPLLQKTIQLAPDYLPARVRLGDSLMKSNQNAEAATVYREVLSRDPENGYAITGLSRTELNGGNPDAARQRLLQFVQRQPQFAPAWGLLISIEERLGNETAVAEYKLRAQDAGRQREMPDPWIDDLMAECYDPYRLSVAASAADPSNNHARARQLLERAVTIAPNDDLPIRLLGNLMSDLGEMTSARTYLERAAQIDPKEPDNWSYLVRVLKAIGDMPAANRALDAGLANCPEAPVLHLEKGRRYAAAGRFEAAAASFAFARRNLPEDSTASMELALVYFKQERLEEGVVALHEVVKIDPNHPVAVVLLARYAISNGDAADAANWIKRARKQPKIAARDLAQVVKEYRSQFGQLP
ncbi:tetratricopeptide repeat domain protein [Verrucomicrobiia bacterium DG1235]|nr:tetratricopeptide repeat domain protein [Verrucomicrobiae bacterium DG1235]